MTADEGLVSGRMTEQNGGAEKVMVCIPELVERLVSSKFDEVIFLYKPST